jgi:hypothetical protein
MINTFLLFYFSFISAEIIYNKVGFRHSVDFVNSEGYQPRQGIFKGQYSCGKTNVCPLHQEIVCESDYYWKWKCFASFPEDYIFDSVAVYCNENNLQFFTYESCRLEYSTRRKGVSEEWIDFFKLHAGSLIWAFVTIGVLTAGFIKCCLPRTWD